MDHKIAIASPCVFCPSLACASLAPRTSARPPAAAQGRSRSAPPPQRCNSCSRLKFRRGKMWIFFSLFKLRCERTVQVMCLLEIVCWRRYSAQHLHRTSEHKPKSCQREQHGGGNNTSLDLHLSSRHQLSRIVQIHSSSTGSLAQSLHCHMYTNSVHVTFVTSRRAVFQSSLEQALNWVKPSQGEFCMVQNLYVGQWLTVPWFIWEEWIWRCRGQ